MDHHELAPVWISCNDALGYIGERLSQILHLRLAFSQGFCHFQLLVGSSNPSVADP